MALTEFDLIKRYFQDQKIRHSATACGIGDDCALLSVEESNQLAVTIDTMVEGTHFFSGVDPASLGYKILAVSLSDLAAMGAEPRWITLGLTLPNAHEDWLESFAGGLFRLAETYSIELIGGDTTRGPLTVAVQAFGVVPAGTGMRRSGAKTDDLVYVTGCIGDAGIGLLMEQRKLTFRDVQAIERLHCPQPRVSAGMAIRGLANACIDISDGLLADLRHVLEASHVGAAIEWDKIPFSPAVLRYIEEGGDWRLPLRTGDDYELCFTVPPGRESELTLLLDKLGVPCTCIGLIEDSPGVRIIRQGEPQNITVGGYEHFAQKQ